MAEPPLFLDTPLPSPITEFVCQVISNVDGEDHYASGTAIIVAPHLAFGARHVLEGHWARHHRGPMPLAGATTTRFSFVLAQLVGGTLNLWTVTRLWTSALTDIVLLRLTPWSKSAGEYRFRRLAIDVLPPQVGEHVHAFGYSDSTVIENRPEDGPKDITLTQRAITTHGDVIEVFPDRRDPITMPFPCFRTNARFDGGMSGGPVFNASGGLCGLVCSTYPPFTADEDHASYVVLLWPAMAISIDLDRVGHPKGVRYRVFDLIADNILIVKNADRLTVGPLDPSGGTSQIALHVPWRPLDD